MRLWLRVAFLCCGRGQKPWWSSELHSAHLKALNALVLLEQESTLCDVPHFASPTACGVVAAHQLLHASGRGPNEADVDGPEAVLASWLFLVGATPSHLSCRMMIVGHLPAAAVFVSSTN